MPDIPNAMEVPRKLVLIHGLFMNGLIMRPLSCHFRRLGYKTLVLNYPTRSKTLAETADDWLPRILQFADGQTVDMIGHSLGGLLIRHLRTHMPTQIRRAATLGTPHMGSATARYFRHFWHGRIIAQSWPQALDGHAPSWDSQIPLLSVAGNKSSGIGTWFGLFHGESNDGTVAVAETHLPEATAYYDLPYGHTGMLFGKETMSVLKAWFNQTP